MPIDAARQVFQISLTGPTPRSCLAQSRNAPAPAKIMTTPDVSNQSNFGPVSLLRYCMCSCIPLQKCFSPLVVTPSFHNTYTQLLQQPTVVHTTVISPWRPFFANRAQCAHISTRLRPPRSALCLPALRFSTLLQEAA